MGTSEIKIKRTDSADPDFAALVKKLDLDLLGRYGEQQSFFDQFNKLDGIKTAIVAYVDGVPAGCGAFKRYSDEQAEMKRVYVSDEFRRRGIAQQVMAALELWASELGFKEAILETAVNQPEAIAMYEKIGYVRMENYGDYVGVEMSVCMRKNLMI